MELDLRKRAAGELQVVLDLASYTFKELRRDGELILYRGHPANPSHTSVLIVTTLAEPSPAALRSIQHEYALRNEVGPHCAVLPLAVERLNGHSALVLEDPGGIPLDQLLNGPMELAQFLRERAIQSRIVERGESLARRQMRGAAQSIHSALAALAMSRSCTTTTSARRC